MTLYFSVLKAIFWLLCQDAMCVTIQNLALNGEMSYAGLLTRSFCSKEAVQTQPLC